MSIYLETLCWKMVLPEKFWEINKRGGGRLLGTKE